MACRCLLALVLLLVQTRLLPARAPAASWRQQRFAITFLEDEFGPAPRLPAYYQAIASLNFTVAEGWGEGRPLATVELNLAVAAGAGLDSIVSGYSPTGSQPNPVPLTNSTSRSLLGFLVKDEPKVTDFAQLAAWSQQLAVTHPGKLRFINLLPNCSAMGTPVMSNASYTEYVHRFVAEVKPDLLAFDMYPDFGAAASAGPTGATAAGPSRTARGGRGGRSDVANSPAAYRSTLALFRSLALQRKIPLWNYFRSTVKRSPESPYALLNFGRTDGFELSY